MRRLSLPCLMLTLTLVSVSQPSWSQDWRFDDVDRVVAMSDIHGAYDAMVETLQRVDILGDDLSWSGGESHLVIVGDIIDRGPKSRAAMDLLMRLEGEAASAGGRVHILIGNHESMLLTGDLRYVSAPEYQAFASDENPEERADWFNLYAARRGGNVNELLVEFDSKYPPGYFAMRRAFRADGQYGQWLLQKNIIAVINGTAFVHGGLSPVVARIGLEGVNVGLQKELADYVSVLARLTDAKVLLPTDSHYDYANILGKYMPALDADPLVLAAVKDGIRLGKSDVLATDGPLWYRNNTVCPGIVEEYRFDAALKAIGVERVVVGHTPTPGREVLQRFDGRLIEVDTGMLNFYYKGRGHALVLEQDSMTVTDQSGRESEVIAAHPRSVGYRPGGMSAQDLGTLLREGEITAIEKLESGGLPQTVVKISDGEYTVDSIFSEREGKGFFAGVAAFRLDKLLQLDMVPVTVKREVEGDEGSLQYLPANSTDEFARSASGDGGNALCSIPDQWAAMYVFDVLIYNQGRAQRRMLYDRASWHLILSEHERAFAKEKGRPQHLKNFQLTVTPGWKNALAELSDEVLTEQFSDVLDKKRRRALAARRDELIATQ